MSKVDSREATIKTVAEIVNHLIISYEKNEPVNLTKLKTQISRKYKLPNMPKRSTLLSKQRLKPLSSKEWISANPKLYTKYKDQIDTIRAFGLRRREITGGTSYNGRDGLGDKSLYKTKDGHLFAVVLGKGGKVRWTECRWDLQAEMEKIYGSKIRPMADGPKTLEDFKHNLQINIPFYKPFSHSVPTHIHRAAYAQNMIQQLNQQTYTGYRDKIIYYRDGLKAFPHQVLLFHNS